MAYYSDLLNLKDERFFKNLAVSSLYIYTIRFIDFALITWILTDISNNPSTFGLLIFVKFSPMMFSGLISGWIVDKVTRLTLIKVVIYITSLYLLFWAVYLFYFEPSLIIIFILTFISGILISLDISARQSYLASLVKRKRLRAGIALNIILLNIAWFIGPNIGIFFMNFMTFDKLYLLMTLINSINLFFLYKMPKLSIPKSEKNKYSGMSKGISFALSNKIIHSMNSKNMKFIV